MKKILYLFLILFLVGGVSVDQVLAKTVKTKKISTKTQVVKKTIAPVKKSKVATKKVSGKKVKVASIKDSSDYVPPTRFSAEAAAQKPAFNGAKQPPEGYMEAVNTALNDFLKAKKAANGNAAKIKDAEDAYNAALEAAGAMLQ